MQLKVLQQLGKKNNRQHSIQLHGVYKRKFIRSAVYSSCFCPQGATGVRKNSLFALVYTEFRKKV